MPELDGSLRRNVLIHFFRSCCARLFVDLSKDLTEKEFGLHIISILSLAFKNVVCFLHNSFYVNFLRKVFWSKNSEN